MCVWVDVCDRIHRKEYNLIFYTFVSISPVRHYAVIVLWLLLNVIISSELVEFPLKLLICAAGELKIYKPHNY